MRGEKEAFGRTIAAFGAIVRHRRGRRAAVERFRDERLRRLVRHAWDRVPVYRRLWEEHGVRPHDVSSAADLPALPLISKAELRAAGPDDVLARGVDPDSLVTTRTSGVTGEPFVIRKSWLEVNLLYLFRLRAWVAAGVRPGDRVLRLRLMRTRQPRDHKLIGAVLGASRIQVRRDIDMLMPPEEVAAEIDAFRPDVVAGQPGTLARLVEWVSSGGRIAHRPRMIVSGAEVLTPHGRERIREALGAEVFDFYGCHEANLLAAECAEGRISHVPDDSVILEVLGPDGSPTAPGERGSVVITNLYCYAMPFIRYRLGDLAVRGEGECECGRPFSTLGAVAGRELEMFRLPGGRVIHPYELVRAMGQKKRSWIGRYQFRQEREDHVVLRVVPLGEPPGEPGLSAVQERLSAVLGPDVRCDVVLVEDLEPSDGVKFRVAVPLGETA